MSQNSIWNTKRNFSRIFFFISKLSRWLRYSIKIFSAEFMRYYQQCTTGTSLLCSIYVFILHTGRPTKSKTCLTKLECLLLASVREKEKRTFLKKFLHSHKTSRSIWVNTAFPLNSYKQLLPSPKSAWDGGSSESSRVSFEFFFSLLLWNFPSLQLLVALSVHHRGFQEESSICNRGHTRISQKPTWCWCKKKKIK